MDNSSLHSVASALARRTRLLLFWKDADDARVTSNLSMIVFDDVGHADPAIDDIRCQANAYGRADVPYCCTCRGGINRGVIRDPFVLWAALIKGQRLMSRVFAPFAWLNSAHVSRNTN